VKAFICVAVIEVVLLLSAPKLFAETEISLPPLDLQNPGIYVHAGSEGTGFDVSGNITGTCVYWSDPVRVGGRAPAVKRALVAGCIWDREGTLVVRGPFTQTVVGRAFQCAGPVSPDDHIVCAESPDGALTGRRVSTVTGFALIP
jgi:hypothetical protein